MGPFEVRVAGEADLAAALGELWASVEGGCSSGFLQVSQLEQSQDSRGCAGNCTSWPVFMLGLRALLGGCKKPEEPQPCSDLCP